MVTSEAIRLPAQLRAYVLAKDSASTWREVALKEGERPTYNEPFVGVNFLSVLEFTKG